MSTTIGHCHVAAELPLLVVAAAQQLSASGTNRALQNSEATTSARSVVDEHCLLRIAIDGGMWQRFVMAFRQPPSRKQRERSAPNDPRRLSEKPPPIAERAALACRATFAPYAKHKRNPSAYRLKPYQGQDEDRTYCDEHARFFPADMPRAPMLLMRGINAGLFGKKRKKGDPGLLWSVDDNGWIYEAQITNPGYAVYHAYPVLPNEAIARKVLVRYTDFVNQQNDPQLTASLTAARRRYL